MSRTREHGTYVRYVTDKCRCDLCKQARSDYERARRQRTAPAYVGADRARSHVAWLGRQGVGLKTVSARRRHQPRHAQQARLRHPHPPAVQAHPQGHRGSRL